MCDSRFVVCKCPGEWSGVGTKQPRQYWSATGRHFTAEVGDDAVIMYGFKHSTVLIRKSWASNRRFENHVYLTHH